MKSRVTLSFSDPPASTSRGLELQVRPTMPGLCGTEDRSRGFLHAMQASTLPTSPATPFPMQYNVNALLLLQHTWLEGNLSILIKYRKCPWEGQPTHPQVAGRKAWKRQKDAETMTSFNSLGRKAMGKRAAQWFSSDACVSRVWRGKSL